MKNEKFKNTSLKYHDTVCRPIFPLLPERVTSVLDIGGGTGATVLEVKKLCSASVVGVIDISQDAVDNGKEGLDFIECGNVENSDLLEKLTEKYGPFDLILCLDVLEHLVDPWKFLKRIDDVLVPGGCMISSIPNVRHYSATLRLLLGQWDYRDSGILDRTHLRFFIKKTVISLVTSTGMELESLTTTRAKNYKFITNIIYYLTLGLMKPFFELQYITRVRKK
jgi:2-polyprenyl-3-methyl-5-hydroxy-6-metoxy-1,4-benzoquinol methylase